MMGRFFLAVTDDEYELPVAVAESQEELAAMTGVPIATIRLGVWKTNRGMEFKARKSGMKFYAIREKKK